MPEIISTDQLKIIPWGRSEKLLVCERTKQGVLVMGLKDYFRKRKNPGPTPKKHHHKKYDNRYK